MEIVCQTEMGFELEYLKNDVFEKYFE